MPASAAPAAETTAALPGTVVQSFESAVVGVPVAKLDIAATAGADLAGLARQWRARGLWLVSCRIPETDERTRKALESIGFKAVETLVTFWQDAQPGEPSAWEIGPARADETEDCIRLALAAFTFDRLHRDAHVPDAVADAVRAAWVRNDLAGRAAAPLVARDGGRVVGFNLCLKKERTAVIDLIAVEQDHRGQGLAAAMIEAAFAHFGDAVDGIRVGTQAENPASIRLYEKTGFAVEKRETTLHWINLGVEPQPAG